ncbi:MAG TPA: T9SS type A sorting domain-containing protein, partial [Flavitalea sp.]|nr:T9SS type A sorting domain-containing protein [Flavitalea sp.]
AGMNVIKRFVSLLLLTLIISGVYAQDGLTRRYSTPIGTNVGGFLQYLPVGYSAAGNTQKYPLIIYIHGASSNGDGGTGSTGLIKLWTGSGTPHEQQDPTPNDPNRAPYWVDAYAPGGTGPANQRFVIITPQFIQDMVGHLPTPDEVNSVIDYAIANYRIDISRIYLMGHSQGGGVVWDYVGSSSANARRIAAVIPFSGVSFPFQEKANIMRNAGVKVWAFHNNPDNQVPTSFSVDYVNYYNNAPAPPVPAKLTLFPVSPPSHLSWIGPLERVYTDNGLDIYEWLLQYQSTPSTAFAGEDREITLPTSSAQLSGSATGGTVTNYAWIFVSGPATGSIANANTATPTVSNMTIKGTYVYRLTVTYSNGSTATDLVAVNVNPGAQRIQAENYSAISGTVRTDPFAGGTFDFYRNETADDPAPNNFKMDGINGTADWMDYVVNVPVAGTYRFRFRTGTGTGGTRFVVKNAAGSPISSTVEMFATTYDTYMNLFTNVQLAQGTQTIRIQSASDPAFADKPWFMNWFEIIDGTVANNSPLPVNFVWFNAGCAGGSVNLTWKTAGEINSKDYTVEKSADGRIWNSIATILSAGQSGSDQTYSYSDPGAANNLYRIVETGLDGRKTYSSSIRSNCSEKGNLGVYPNPVLENAVVSIALDQKSKVQLTLIDSRGAIIQQHEVILPKGNNQLPLNMNAFSKGNYTLIGTWNGTSQSIKLIKK